MFHPKILIFSSLLFGNWLCSSCVTSVEKEIVLQPSATEDKPYGQAYYAATKKFEITSNFETKHVITITRLDQEFLSRFSERYRRLFNESAPVLNEASSKLGFFVSLYSADSKANELDNSSLWNIQLGGESTLLKPEVIKVIRTKKEWTPFFPDVSVWTKEYFILFANNPQTLSKNSKLIISNADNRIEFSL